MDDCVRWSGTTRRGAAARMPYRNLHRTSSPGRRGRSHRGAGGCTPGPGDGAGLGLRRRAARSGARAGRTGRRVPNSAQACRGGARHDRAKCHCPLVQRRERRWASRSLGRNVTDHLHPQGKESRAIVMSIVEPFCPQPERFPREQVLAGLPRYVAAVLGLQFIFTCKRMKRSARLATDSSSGAALGSSPRLMRPMTTDACSLASSSES